MRLLNIDLDRYGAFNGQRLVLREDARLHVVYGRNEAGKSSALAAITDLLFGFERQTRYDFRFESRELLLGATIRDQAGRELSFRRRKVKPLLSDLQNGALADDVLTPFLGGLSRDVFRRAFGLDSEALRRSGEDLQNSDGELGAALFAAASGLRGLGQLRASLEGDADKIFADRRSQNRTFYQALDRYEAARKSLRDHETRAGALKELREKVERQTLELASIANRRATIAAELARSDRIRRTLPTLQSIAAFESELAGLGDLPSAPEGHGAFILAALAEASDARRLHDEAAAILKRIFDQHELIVVDEALLAAREQIEYLKSERGRYAKNLQDIPRIQHEADGFSGNLGALAIRLGLTCADDVIDRQPTAAALAFVGECVASGRKYIDALAVATRTREGLERELDQHKHARDLRGVLLDPAPFRERLQAFDELLRRLMRRDEEAPLLEAEERKLRDFAARLAPPVAVPASLAHSSLPLYETIGGFARRFDDLANRKARLVEVVEQTRSEKRRQTAVLADLSASGDVPSRERIEASRLSRDEYWKQLQSRLLGDVAGETPASTTRTILSFENAVSAADAIADAAIADAARVAKYEIALLRLGEQESLLSEQAQKLEILNAEHSDVKAEWLAIWTHTGIAPLAPAEMREWRTQIDHLFERHQTLDARRRERDASTRAADVARPALVALATSLGLEPMAELGLPLLASRVRTEIERLQSRYAAGREEEARLALLDRQAEDVRQSIAKSEANLATWREQFRAAVLRIGLNEEAGIAEAEAVLATWSAVPTLAENRADRLRRVSGMRADVQRFSDAVAEISGRLMPDVSVDDAEIALQQLASHLDLAREAHMRREEMQRRLVDATTSAKLAEKRVVAATDVLRPLLASDGFAESAFDLEAIARRLERRDHLMSELKTARRRLGEIDDGAGEEALRAALSGRDPDRAQGERETLLAEQGQLESKSQLAYKAQADATQQLDALEGRLDAETALQQRLSAEAELVQAARDWAVHKIAALMVGTAINRQRSGQQEPVLIRAGELFGPMTAGSYLGLGQSFDEDDRPHIAGLRRDGSEVGIAGMSEGTRDQLYLALRLAWLEDYASRAEPPPFLGDDLFASFDDERTAHGLKALAAIGQKVQPVLFTHHRFVVDIARRELGDAVDIVELQ